MPYTLNGFGTRYYGRREPGEDGSYVTTLWITALYIPVLPLGSYRVLPVGEGTNYIVHSSQSYRVLRVPLCWEQVWRVYMVGAPILIVIAWLIASSAKKDRLKESLHGRLSAAGSEINSAPGESESEGSLPGLVQLSRNSKEGKWNPKRRTARPMRAVGAG